MQLSDSFVILSQTVAQSLIVQSDRINDSVKPERNQGFKTRCLIGKKQHN
jgi:hypothetical protein